MEHILIFEAIKVEGKCPVYSVGDRTVIKGPTIDLKNSDGVCVHALFCLGPFLMALREGVPPAHLGLSKKKDGDAYFHCLDPGKPYTNGGTVLFKVSTSQKRELPK
jgi:uncharacterized repeat protein (TIGR04076 family)